MNEDPDVIKLAQAKPEALKFFIYLTDFVILKIKPECGKGETMGAVTGGIHN